MEIAVADSSVIFLALDMSDGDRAVHTRANLVTLAKDHTIVVPAIVVAELGHLPDPIDQIALEAVHGSRVEQFDLEAGKVARGLVRKVLDRRKALPKDERPERSAVKYDLLIASTAQALGAKLLLTGDVDYTHITKVMTDPKPCFEVVRVDEPLRGKQSTAVVVLRSLEKGRK